MLIGLQTGQASALIQSTFIGIWGRDDCANTFCMKLPMAQGPSYVPLGAIVGIYGKW